MKCAGLIKRGPHAGKPAKGTRAGYYRHVQNGESPCDVCRRAVREFERTRRASRRREKVESRRSEPLPSARSEPAFVGSRSVRCRGCGSRGSVNRRLIGHTQWTVDECRNCR